MQQRTMTAKDAAEYLGLSLNTVWKLFKAGKIKAARITNEKNCKWLTWQEACDEFLFGQGGQAQ